MAKKKEETASFVLRFTQKIYSGEDGESQVQWRGNIRHVQGGEEKRFSEFEEAYQFIQNKLADLTIQAVEGKSPEEQKGILAKSFDLWRRMAMETPKMVIETIKDPKKQVAQLQDQLQDQFSQVRDEIGQKLEIDNWIGPTKVDFNQLSALLDKINRDIGTLHDKVDQLSKKPRSKK